MCLLTIFLHPGCSRILRSRSVDSVKFASQYAYLKYPRWTDESEGTFECHVKTRQDQGVLLFNDGWNRSVLYRSFLNRSRGYYFLFLNALSGLFSKATSIFLFERFCLQNGAL